MAKHDNYKNPAIITIRKTYIGGEENYQLSYDDEDWGLCGSKEEILEEISEHLDLVAVENSEK